MSHPPPFVLPAEGRGARVRAVLAGAGRQRVAVALLALAALLGGGDRVGQGHAQAGRRRAGQGAVAPADQTLPRAAPDTPRRPGPGIGSRCMWPGGSAGRAWSACPPAAGSTTPSGPRAA